MCYITSMSFMFLTCKMEIIMQHLRVMGILTWECMCVYVYTHICIYTCTCIHSCIYYIYEQCNIYLYYVLHRKQTIYYNGLLLRCNKDKISKLKQTKMREAYRCLMEHKCKHASSNQERWEGTRKIWGSLLFLIIVVIIYLLFLQCVQFLIFFSLSILSFSAPGINGRRCSHPPTLEILLRSSQI